MFLVLRNGFSVPQSCCGDEILYYKYAKLIPTLKAGIISSKDELQGKK
jgi:hypothetical protein